MASLQMNKLPWWGQLLVFVFVGALVVGGYYYFYEQQARADLDVREAELAAIRGRIDKGMETARQLPEFRAQVGDLETRLESLKAILPEEKDVAELLRRLQTLASQSSLTIRHFRPRAIATKELHAEWPIEIEVEGSYHNVGQFLDRVSKLPRIINVGAMEMNTVPQQRPGVTVRVTCTAMTFVLNDQTSTPQPGAPAATGPAKKTE
ncbi:MAG: type 4a pilus biogenesis protein PilO [Acidobacteria bacterium]|nr:type 4a pilus biogenesis protein PilO [Acidobacteriota bacterium]